VWDRNGEFRGVIQQVLGDYFQLLDRDETSRWFPRARLHRYGARFELDFARDEAASVSVPAPDAYEETQYIEPEARTDEQQQQREQVLRDMARHRQELRSASTLLAAERTVGEPVEQELEELVHGEPDEDGATDSRG
jgi:hypothetical protein